MKTIYSSISKRVFSLLVALIMAISTVPFAAASAFAQEQGISIALALTELFIAEKQRGACRIHGGGFAGVITAMLPNDIVDEYIDYIEHAMGAGSAYRMSIRPYGAVCVNDII